MQAYRGKFENEFRNFDYTLHLINPFKIELKKSLKLN